jgi:hypothetical protein
MKILRYSQRYAIADCHKVRLPRWIEKTHSCINIKNKDSKCFLWFVLRVLHPVNHNKERISDLEQYKDSIDTSMLEFPVEYNSRNIKKFEEVNNLRISIFCLEDKESKVYPLYVSNRNESTRID